MKRIINYTFSVFLIFSTLTVLTIWLYEGESFHDSLFITLMLFGAGEPLILNISELTWLTGTMMIGQTLVGLASLTLAFGLLANFLVSEKIAKLMTKEKITMKDHVIICGLGNVGFQVMKELELLGQEMLIIDRGDDKDYIELARKRGHKVLIENLKDEAVLEEAQLVEAKSIIICTGNDLLNMEVALNTRKKRADIVIVMRMFDQDLAQKVAEAFDVKVAFSASALAAPVFAAASFDRTVFQTVRVEKELFVTAQLDVEENSDLIGLCIQQLMEKDLVVLKLISGEERLKFPTLERPIKVGDRIYITCSLDTLKEMKRLNKEEQK